MIIFLGAPGSGKGTQSRILAKEHGYELFSVGEILRKEIEADTQIGKQLEERLAKGEFANLEIVVQLLKNYVTHKKFILDGFPRNLEQANELLKFVQENEKIETKDLVVIDFVVPADVLVHRLHNRRLCKVCDAAIIQDAIECTFCGQDAELAYKRSDDNLTAIQRRLDIFNREQASLVAFFRDLDIYHEIDATNAIDNVATEVKKIIKID